MQSPAPGEEQSLQERGLTVFKTMWEGAKKKVRLFLVGLGDRMRDNGYKIKLTGSLLSIRKCFLTYDDDPERFWIFHPWR